MGGKGTGTSLYALYSPSPLASCVSLPQPPLPSFYFSLRAKLEGMGPALPSPADHSCATFPMGKLQRCLLADKPRPSDV